MSASRYPCLECAEPFDDPDVRALHWADEGHGPRQVQADAVDKARYSVMGDAAPEPENVYRPDFTTARRRLRVIPGGRR